MRKKSNSVENARAFGYSRVSTAEQAADGTTSLATQAEACSAIAKLHGLEIAKQFCDAGVSGSKPMADRLRAHECSLPCSVVIW